MTVTVAVVVAATLVATKEILPDPLAARPMAGLLLVQVKVEPVVVEVKLTEVEAPPQVVTLAG